MSQFRRFAALLVVLALLISATACATAKPTVIPGHPRIRIEMADGHSMLFELYPEFAPETVANFLSLVDAKFYDGLTFHRLIKSTLIQGGDPKGDGTGSSGKSIKGEFATNGFKQNTLSHTFGTISMARTSDMNSATCQFFILAGDGSVSTLDGKYAAFGRLIEGTSVLLAVAAKPVVVNAATGEESQPVEPVVIAHIVRVAEGTPTPAA
jgi:peptidylprolyl isomerase/peptidyl-prolyl cis-trans isomerase B (cyclophilin B)